MKTIISIFVTGLYIFLFSLQLQSQTNLYVSKQTMQYSEKNHNYTYTSDNYEQLTTTTNVNGPILHIINPDLDFEKNTTETWLSKVRPDLNNIPESGTSDDGEVLINYNYTYSRPKKILLPFGNFGAFTINNSYVTNTYTCFGCNAHGGVPGDHEIIHVCGTYKKEYKVYSIKMELPNLVSLTVGSQKDINCVRFPLVGGDVEWSLSNANVQIIDSDKEKVKIQGVAGGNCVLTGKFTINGVNFIANCLINIISVSLSCTEEVLAPPLLMEVKCIATGKPTGGIYDWIFPPNEFLDGFGSSGENAFCIIKKPAGSTTVNITVKYTRNGKTATASQPYNIGPGGP